MHPGNAPLGPILDGQTQLRRDFQNFALGWSATKEVWRDDRREQFEREHLATLGPSLARLCAALDHWRDFVSKCDRELAESVAEASAD